MNKKCYAESIFGSQNNIYTVSYLLWEIATYKFDIINKIAIVKVSLRVGPPSCDINKKWLDAHLCLTIYIFNKKLTRILFCQFKNSQRSHSSFIER